VNDHRERGNLQGAKNSTNTGCDPPTILSKLDGSRVTTEEDGEEDNTDENNRKHTKTTRNM
jgi:hypothetical protein